MQLRVAIQHEKNKAGAAAEVHERRTTLYVLEGAATLTLGGKLDAPQEVQTENGAEPASAAVRRLRLTKVI